MRSFLLTFCRAAFVVYSLVFAASAQIEVLRNSDVVDMVKAGLSIEVLVKTVNAANTSFDVTPVGLISLKKAGVPDQVISAMVDRQSTTSSTGSSDSSPAFSESRPVSINFVSAVVPVRTKKEIVESAKTIAFEKSSAHPSRQALEKELMKLPGFKESGLKMIRYKDSADLYVEIGYVPLSWLTHRYVYRIYERKSGTVLAAGETTSWGSLAANLAKHIARDLAALRQ